MDTTIRTLAMLDLIPTRPHKITVKSLREKLIDLDPDFEVSERTIMRDLNALSVTFHISSDGFKPQGWSKLKQHELASLKMDIRTARVFKEVEKLVSKKLTKDYLEVLQPFFKQANFMKSGADHNIDYSYSGKNDGKLLAS